MKVDRENLPSNIYVERRIKDSLNKRSLRITHNPSENSFQLCTGADRLEIKNLYIFSGDQEPSAKELNNIL